jgi:hypothetical protein
MKNNLYKIVAGLIIILLTLVFFWKILLTNLIVVGIDAFLYFTPYKAFAAEALRQGRLPLWNPHLFMGAPLLANSQVGIFYPFNWIFIWLDAPKQIAWSIGLHITLAGIFMLAYTRLSLRLRWASALISAILFAFGGYLGAQVEHINQLNAAVWLPLLFLFYDFGIEQRHHRRWFWFLLLAVTVSLTLLAGHAQTVFISLFGLGLYALWQGVEEIQKQRKPDHPTFLFNLHPSSFAKQDLILAFTRYLWPLIVVCVLAAALAALQLIPTAELSSLSIRRGGLPFREVVSFSLSPATLHYALLPPLGDVDLAQVWDEAFSERMAYLGISGLILALLGGISAIWQHHARRFVFLACSGLFLSLGVYSGIYLVLYYVIPGFSLFRVPPRWLLLYGFSAAILAGYGFNALLTAAARDRLTEIWCWRRTRWWALAICTGLPVIGFLVLIIWKRPPLTTFISWLIITLITLGLVYFIIKKPHLTPRLSPLLIVLLITELFWAAQSLNYNHPTAPQAHHSMRNSVAFLRAAATDSLPPDRFLSLSGITYDPGDLHDLEQIFGNSLSPQGFYQLVVATKQKEVLAYNLPLIYNLFSVDGYDGGLLPLSEFVTLQQLFLPPDQLSIDGRLRENLRSVPPSRLLSLLNTRWVITDKVFDTWINGIFYDLQFPAYLDPGQTIATSHIPNFPATTLGVISHLNGAANLPAGTPVAKLTLTFSDDTTETFTLKAGSDTAEGHYSSDTAHPQATIGVAWPYAAEGVDYVSLYRLNNRQPIAAISATGLLPQGQFVLKGLSLIHEPTTTSRSVLLSTEGNYRQVHSGDVKIYENQDVLPRAFIVHQAQIVINDQQAIAAMRDATFDPRNTLVRVAAAGEKTGLAKLGQISINDNPTITSYQPERIELAVTLESPGWLVLTDTHYPGWRATVNGQSTQILPVNIMFRGLELPAGEHIIVFEFKPRSLQVGFWISGLALLILAGAFIISSRRKQER